MVCQGKEKLSISIKIVIFLLCTLGISNLGMESDQFLRLTGQSLSYHKIEKEIETTADKTKICLQVYCSYFEHSSETTTKKMADNGLRRLFLLYHNIKNGMLDDQIPDCTS